MEALNPHSGGDCPENGMEGILRALRLSTEDSHVIVLTDASCLDCHKKDKVIRIALSLNVKIHFFFSGPGCDRDGFPHYKQVQMATKGVHVTSIESFTSLSRFISELRLQEGSSKRSVFSEIPPLFSQKCQTFNISVFTTKFELIVNENSANTKLYNPLGHIVKNEHISDDLSGYISTGHPKYGSWRICTVDKKAASEFTLTKRDILDYSVTFNQDGHYSSAIPMAG